jgi:cytochrome c-type biogenesis protein CcmE
MTQQIQPISSPAAIPTEIGTRSRSKLNTKYLVGGGLLMLFVGFLAFQMIQATITTGAYYMTVAEVQSKAADLAGQRIRVNGNVVAGSEDWNAKEITLKFSIADESGAGQLPIVFYGPRPDNFSRAASAIIEGKLQPDGSFLAETLLLKCPSRYEEEPEEVYVKSNK